GARRSGVCVGAGDGLTIADITISIETLRANVLLLYILHRFEALAAVRPPPAPGASKAHEPTLGFSGERRLLLPRLLEFAVCGARCSGAAARGLPGTTAACVPVGPAVDQRRV